MRMMAWVLALVALGGSGIAPALAAGGQISIQDPWVRASLGNTPNSVAYMTIETEGDQPDRLLGAETPVAEAVQLHSHEVAPDGIARMRPVEAIEVAPEAPVVLEPGGRHLMLIGLKERLEEGQAVPITLLFEHAGALEIELPVRGLGQPSGHTGGGGSH